MDNEDRKPYLNEFQERLDRMDILTTTLTNGINNVINCMLGGNGVEERNNKEVKTLVERPGWLHEASSALTRAIRKMEIACENLDWLGKEGFIK